MLVSIKEKSLGRTARLWGPARRGALLGQGDLKITLTSQQKSPFGIISFENLWDQPALEVNEIWKPSGDEKSSGILLSVMPQR